MSRVIRLLVLASLIATLFGAGALATVPTDAAPAAAGTGLRLVINPPNGSGILSGYLQGVDPSIAFVSLTVTFLDGTSLSINVDSSTGWAFSFGVVPDAGFASLSLTENPIPMPQMIGNDWDYGYMHGYFYPNPYPAQPWGNFPGYSYPMGYGWGDYPFGYYAYPQQLAENYGMPYYWNYAPIYNTPQFTYYGVGGLPETYMPPQYGYSAFGQLTQPYFVQNYSPQAYSPYFTLPNPVLIPQSYVAPIWTPNPPSPPVYTVPAEPAVLNPSGTNVWNGTGGTPNVPQVNLPQYSVPTPVPNQGAPAPNLWQGNPAPTGPSVPQVNLPQYTPPAPDPNPAPAPDPGQTTPAPNLWQGGSPSTPTTPSVPQVNLPQYAPPANQPANQPAPYTPPAPQPQPYTAPQPAPAPQPTPMPSNNPGQSPGTNLWQGSGGGSPNPQPHQQGSVMR